jgi:hypothetical protein
MFCNRLYNWAKFDPNEKRGAKQPHDFADQFHPIL